MVLSLGGCGINVANYSESICCADPMVTKCAQFFFFFLSENLFVQDVNVL